MHASLLLVSASKISRSAQESWCWGRTEVDAAFKIHILYSERKFINCELIGVEFWMNVQWIE